MQQKERVQMFLSHPGNALHLSLIQNGYLVCVYNKTYIVIDSPIRMVHASILWLLNVMFRRRASRILRLVILLTFLPEVKKYLKSQIIAVIFDFNFSS